MKNNPPPKQKQSGGEKESTNRHVYIEPGAKIDFVQDLREEYETAQSDDKTHKNRQLFWTKVAAGLLFATAGLTLWQAYSSHRTLNAIQEQFRLDQRPYISIIKFEIMDSIVDGKPKANQAFEAGKPLIVNLNLKNVGKSSAINTIFHYHVIFGNFDKFRIEPTDKGKNGLVLDPGAERTVTAISVKDPYSREVAWVSADDIVNWDGSNPVMLFGRFSYEDTTGHFYCTPYTLTYLPDNPNWAYSSGMKIGGIDYLVSDLCPDKE